VAVSRTEASNGYTWWVTFVTSMGNLPPMYARDEVQEVQMLATYGGHPTPLSGTFRVMTSSGHATARLPFDASAESLVAALERLPSVGTVTVNRLGPFGAGQYQWLVTFRAIRGDVPALSVDASQLAGTGAIMNVSTLVAGVARSFTGAGAAVRVEEVVAGLPSYTGEYVAPDVGNYHLAVRQLTRGGLHAEYFDNQWLQDTPVVTRLDVGINFDWGEGVITTYGRDYVSARWTGKLRHERSETVTFMLIADDGVRMYWDHELVVDSWDVCCREQRFTVNLVHGVYYDVRVEYRDVRGPAFIHFDWMSDAMQRRPVPADVLYAAAHIVGSPFPITVSPGAADYPYTTAFGEGLNTSYAGLPATFIIQARDATGNNKVTGGDSFAVTIDGDASGPISVVPQYVGAGQYRVTYTVRTAGAHTVSVLAGVSQGTITTGGTHIYCGLGAAAACSPFHMTTLPGPTVASRSYVTEQGAGLIAFTGLRGGVVGTNQQFLIQAVDAHGNARVSGGDDFLVGLYHTATSDAVSAHVLDRQDGTYLVTYTVMQDGAYRLDVQLHGEAVLEVGQSVTPFPHFVHADLHAPSCTATGTGLREAEAGAEASFTIVSRDAFGNVRTGANTASASGVDDVFDVILAGPRGVVYTSSSIKLALYVGASAGRFTLTLDGEATEAVPYDIEAPALHHVLNGLAVAEQQGTRFRVAPFSGTLPAGVTHALYVEVLARDSRFAASRFALDATGLTGVGSSAATLTLAPCCATNGAYPVTYTMYEAGDWNVSVLSGGLHIRGSPFAMFVRPGASHASSSSAFGSGLVASTAGANTSFTLQVRDRRRYEVQTFSIQSTVAVAADVRVLQCTATGGVVRFVWGGVSVALPYDADAAAVAAALLTHPWIAHFSATVQVVPATMGGLLCAAGSPATMTLTTSGVGRMEDATLDDTLLVSGSAVWLPSPRVKGQVASRSTVHALLCEAVPAAAVHFSFIPYVGAAARTVTWPASLNTVAELRAALTATLGSVVVHKFDVGAGTIVLATDADTVCSASVGTGTQYFLTYHEVVGDLAAPTTASPDVRVTHVISGAHTHWGAMRLHVAQNASAPLPHDASAADVRAALEALPSVGSVTVTRTSVGDDAAVPPRPNRYVYAVTFDASGSAQPPNHGDVPAIHVDVSNIAFVAAGQLPPFARVVEYAAGTEGNPRSMTGGLDAAAVELSHRARPEVRVAQRTVQRIACLADAGQVQFRLGRDGEPLVTAHANSSVASFAAALDLAPPMVAAGGVSVSAVDPLQHICSSDGSQLVTVAFIEDGLQHTLTPSSSAAAPLTLAGSVANAYAHVEILAVGSVTIAPVNDSIGLYRVDYVPLTAGTYDASVMLHGALVSADVEAGVTVAPAVQRPSAVTTSHAAEGHAQEGVLEEFNIHVFDDFGNSVDAALPLGAQLMAHLVGTPDVLTGLPSAQVHTHVTITSDVPNTAGMYHAQYMPTAAGAYDLHLSLRRAGGLLGTYYYADDFVNAMPRAQLELASPRQEVLAQAHCAPTRLDANINFAWGYGAPLSSAGFPNDHFSVLWEGALLAPSTGDLTLVVESLDYVRVWLNATHASDAPVIDAWPALSLQSTVTMTMTAGEMLPLRIAYREAAGDASVRLLWAAPGTPAAS
ncbi:hypothetical protein EON62_00145, partial [archaeon]